MKAAAAAVALALAAAPAVAADSFTPVTLTVTIAPVARLHQPLRITVAVAADAGVLDVRTAPLRIRVKLATECGGEYAYTPGTVLLDRALAPQPVTGRPYRARATGAGRPTRFGVETVCVFLEEEGDGRQFATDTSTQVDVSRSCTRRAARYDAAGAALARAERRRPRRPGLVATRRAQATAAQRAARRACGTGVPL